LLHAWEAFFLTFGAIMLCKIVLVGKIETNTQVDIQVYMSLILCGFVCSSESYPLVKMNIYISFS